MRTKKLVLQTTVMGFTADIATINVGSYAKELALNQWTELVCDNCLTKPTYHNSYYTCDCGKTFKSWQKLLRVTKLTKQPVEMKKLNETGTVTKASLFTMPFEEFRNIVDADDPKEPMRFITVPDETSMKNLFKLLVAQQIDNVAIIIRFNDTTEEKIAVLTTTVSGRVVLRFLIPKNLVLLNESLRLDKTALTEQDVSEARMFLKQIPKATEEVLNVKDYRVGALESIGEEKVSEKVQALTAIMQKAKGK